VFSRVAGRTRKTGLILTSRGCPYDCIFCYKSVFGKRYRYRSPQNVVEEIRHLADRYGIRSLGITDDAFTMIKKRTMDICKEIHTENRCNMGNVGRNTRRDGFHRCTTKYEEVRVLSYMVRSRIGFPTGFGQRYQQIHKT
jgi:radical SAM superfamily enzyme YgiQ (UPF0313 family)